MTWRRRLAPLLLCLAACTPDGAGAGKALTVFAAASLRELFEDLATQFERTHPQTKVRLNLAGSQELRTQIEQGARADVFASADWKHMGVLHKAGRVHTPVVFALNEPVIVVAAGNPLGVDSLATLTRAKRLVVGAPEVPIGGYTARIFAAAAAAHGSGLRTELEGNVVSRELNVRQVLAKVMLGEADAGIVYRSDAQASRGKVAIVPIPADLNVVAEYPIAVLASAPHAALARAWVELVTSPEGQQRVAAAGLRAAPSGAATRPAVAAPAQVPTP